MILLIDNYDSFVYNLARYVNELGEECIVKRNDAITLDEISELSPTQIIISPGPCTPNEAGVSLEVVKRFGETLPILGVCLGHQAIGQAYGAKIIRAKRPMHGKRSQIKHNGETLFANVASPLLAARYHSLIVEDASLPKELIVTARTEEGEIMAITHREHPVYGVQFHPESVLTPTGHKLLKNFLSVKTKICARSSTG